MIDEDWVTAAVTDHTMVAELLLRLRHVVQPEKESPPALPLEWSVRQRRSKPILHANNNDEMKNKPTPRTSPTTPLSWSRDTSVSGSGGAADGFEESSRLSRPDSTRSKVNTTGETTTNKRSRKKKTLAELKEEEILLLKESRYLKRELATLRVNLEEKRARNESLKRLKIDLKSQPAVEIVKAVACVQPIPGQTQQKVASCHPISPISPPDVRNDDHGALQLPPTLNGSKMQELRTMDKSFVLPDLNLPLDEDSQSEVLYGVG